MDYITTIRKLIGHRSLILTGATLLALNENNELLMVKRTDNQCWGVPGGMMEPGETLEQTVVRETEEEIGVKPGQLELFGVYSGPKLYYEYPNGDQVYNVAVVYFCENFSDKIQLNLEEHSEYQFFPLDQLPENISPPILPIIHDIARKHIV